MKKRKELKKKARKVFQKHYLFFVIVCLMASFIGAEFTDSLSITRIRNQVSSEEKLLIEDFERDDLTDAEKLVEEKKTEIIKKVDNKVFGHTRGVLATLINSISTGSIYITIIQAIISITKSTHIAIVILILLSLFLTFIIWFYTTNVYPVISRRIFLEGRVYSKVSKQRFLFLLNIKKWTKASFTMFLKYIYQFFWNLTIIGGFIKRYSYFLVPYIVAENPDIKAKDAINLSRSMMNNHKFECFKMDLSFIGWELLGIATFGMTKVLYSNPYKVSFFSEYYNQLRLLAIENKIPNYEYLNDEYLYEKADKKLLEKTYSDIVNLKKAAPKDPIVRESGYKAFLVNNFGITLYSKQEEENYEKEELRKSRINYYQDVINGKSYPNRMFKIQEKSKKRIIENINYLRNYSVTSLILLFFIISFIGWLWEVSLHLISDGVFVNRGALHGPWLPIYGSGGILILIILKKFRKTPLKEFIATICLCGCVEYFTALYLELTHNGEKWWDYSGYFLNLHGRICAEGLLIFGLGGLAIVYVLAPLLDNILRKINKKLAVCLCTILLTIFIIDQCYSHNNPNEGKGITDYAYLYQTLEYRRL